MSIFLLIFGSFCITYSDFSLGSFFLMCNCTILSAFCAISSNSSLVKVEALFNFIFKSRYFSISFRIDNDLNLIFSKLFKAFCTLSWVFTSKSFFFSSSLEVFTGSLVVFSSFFVLPSCSFSKSSKVSCITSCGFTFFIVFL